MIARADALLWSMLSISKPDEMSLTLENGRLISLPTEANRAGTQPKAHTSSTFHACESSRSSFRAGLSFVRGQVRLNVRFGPNRDDVCKVQFRGENVDRLRNPNLQASGQVSSSGKGEQVSHIVKKSLIAYLGTVDPS